MTCMNSIGSAYDKRCTCGDGKVCEKHRIDRVLATDPRDDRPVVGRKDDLGKLRFDLVPALSLEDLARIYTYGAQKYADRNWEKGIEWGRVFAAMMRHLWAFWGGETTDPESGMPHMAHAAWGCFTLLEYARTHNELDTRPTTPDAGKRRARSQHS